MACLDVCEPGAVIHNQQETIIDLEVSGLVSSRELSPTFDAGCQIHLQGVESMVGASAAFEVYQSIRPPELIVLEQDLGIKDPGNGIGLVVCQCGGEVSDHIDTAWICKDAGEWPEISRVMEIPSACSPEGADQIRELMEDNQLGKLILAACSCCSLDQVCYSCTYQRIRCKGNLGVFSDVDELGGIEFVNIREGAAYIYPRSRKKATQAARTLIEAALGRKITPYQYPGEVSPLKPAVLVVGKGESAEICHEALLDLGLSSSRLEVLSDQIIRRGGRFITSGPEDNLHADCLILAPSSGAELDFISGLVIMANQRAILDRNQIEDVRRLGIFICPPSLDSAISGKGAAGEVLAWMGRMVQRRRQPAAWVDPVLCRNCGTCLEVCGLGIPDSITDDQGWHAWINPLLCLDCGTCTAHCPSGAIQPGVQPDRELVEILERVLD
jgi:heterodisulfide reductase subunit A